MSRTYVNFILIKSSIRSLRSCNLLIGPLPLLCLPILQTANKYFGSIFVYVVKNSAVSMTFNYSARKLSLS